MRSHKIRLFPTKEQEQDLLRACGCSRFVYNWGLAKWKELYEQGESCNEFKLSKLFNAIKHEQFPWVTEVPKSVYQGAFRDINSAFQKFFRNIKQGKTPGYPKFKKKEGSKDSFYIDNTNPLLKEKSFRLPKTKIPIRMATQLRFNGKIMSYTVSRDVDRWYVSVSVEAEDKLVRKQDQGTVGVDLGVKTLAVLSNGESYKNPRHTKTFESRLTRAQRALARKQRGSKNRAKTKLKVAKLHRKVRLARSANLHHLTTYLATNFTTVCIEDLAVGNMLKNRHLAKAISDCGFAEFRRQLEYKCVMTGTKLVVADRWFASSKTCSSCGYKHEDLKLKDRAFLCPSCHYKIDRDLNASYNLKNLGTCCADVKPVETSNSKSMKQEYHLLIRRK